MLHRRSGRIGQHIWDGVGANGGSQNRVLELQERYEPG